ncbi:MAG: GNAT family N-acetyltransferase [Candidatus Kapaibacterium sp.]
MSMLSSEISSFEPLALSRFFEQHPVLVTERLRLRELTLDDAESVFAYASDPEVTRYMIFPTHTSIADSIAYLETCPQNFAARERIPFAIELKEAREFIGACDFHHIVPQHHRIEVGYTLNRNHWGKGYMSEALREMIRFAFEEMGMHRLAATCDFDNVRSAAVMERCGMQLEGVHRDFELRRGRFVTAKMYAILNGN